MTGLFGDPVTDMMTAALGANYKRAKDKRGKKGKFQGSEQYTGIDPNKPRSAKPGRAQPRRVGDSQLGGVRSPLSVR